jgi:hypothetical protein
MTVVLKYTPFLENWEVKAKERKKSANKKGPYSRTGLVVCWLPRLLSQSVLLWDGMRIKLERIAKGHTRMILEDKLPRNLLISSPYGGYLHHLP